jgi:hypothetical protein
MNIGETSQIVATFVSAAGLLLLAWQSYLLRKQVNANADQLRLTQESMRATLDGQLFARLDAINSLVAQQYKLYEGLFQPFNPDIPRKNDPTHILADIALTLYEHVFNIHDKYKMMSPSEWESWEHSMDQVFELPYFSGYWKAHARKNYKPEYRNLVDIRIERLANKASA